MDADNASIPETPKHGISASTELTPADRSEPAIFGTRDDSGSTTTAATGTTTIYCRAHYVLNAKRIRFDLWKPSLTAKTGIRLDQGKMYRIQGKIGDVCSFQ